MTMPSTEEWSNLESESMEEYEEAGGEEWFEFGYNEDPDEEEYFWFEETPYEEMEVSNPGLYENIYGEELTEEELAAIDEDLELLMEEKAPELWDFGEEEGEGWLSKLLGNKDLLNILAKAGLGALSGFNRDVKKSTTPRSSGGGGGSGKAPAINALLGMEKGVRKRTA